MYFITYRDGQKYLLLAIVGQVNRINVESPIASVRPRATTLKVLKYFDYIKYCAICINLTSELLAFPIAPARPQFNSRLKETFIKLDWGVCTSLTQLHDGRDVYRIYYIKKNYMFRPFTLAIIRLRNEKNLVSSFTRVTWVVYSGEVRVEVGTRSCMCCVGWVVWVQGFRYYTLF